MYNLNYANYLLIYYYRYKILQVLHATLPPQWRERWSQPFHLTPTPRRNPQRPTIIRAQHSSSFRFSHHQSSGPTAAYIGYADEFSTRSTHVRLLNVLLFETHQYSVFSISLMILSFPLTEFYSTPSTNHSPARSCRRYRKCREFGW